MVNSQTSPATSGAILTNLLEADATLAAQEADITIQLEALRGKRQSLKTVIDLFSATADAATSAQPTPDLSAPKSSPVASPDPSPTAPTEEAAAPTSTRGRKPARATKQTRQSKNWQDYLQDPFRQTSLPAAITSVFQQQPKQLLSVPDLINTIFVAEIPQDVRNKARDRMLNILSTGAKDGQWHRARKGQYSLSKAAAEASR
ncbi:MAG TPA: hypothetical protein V6D16_19885 [Candidatus Obscuribacterales bacterium]